MDIRDDKAIKDIQDQIIAVISNTGPLLGSELVEKLDVGLLDIWRASQFSHQVLHTPFANHYLRIDKERVERPRLSPSILRTYLTYTYISTLDQRELSRDLAAERLLHHAVLSAQKKEFARDFIEQNLSTECLANTSVLIGGDVVRDMAHDVTRPEKSTGKLVHGSDIDLVFIIETEKPDLRKQIEDEMQDGKYMALNAPGKREEIDFIVNSVAHYFEAVKLKTAQQMISAKVLLEAELIAGNATPFLHARGIFNAYNTMAFMANLTEQAFSDRLIAMERLRKDPALIDSEAERRLFYFSDEIWEFMLENRDN